MYSLLMKTEMIERVMDAIMSRSQGHIYLEDQIEEMARSAIEAMREPTESMVEAGLAENACSLPGGRSIMMAVEPAWEAMIEAALSNAKPPVGSDPGIP